MNILEVEDKIKGLPDQMLFKEAQMPSGSVPQFLVISEIQRRAKMRQGAKKPPTETVSDKVVQEGIASLMPPQQAPMAPQGIAQAGPQMGMNAPMAQQPRTSPAQPMMMASGGVTKMQTGGVSPFGSGFDAQQGMGGIIDYLYNQQMQQAQDQREAAEQARARAEERGTSLQEQARKDAFNQALVGIGTGIARGDMAGGFAAGSQSAQERMREARQQALRASERGEALALSQEQAARQAELGAGTFGAQQRLAALQAGQRDYNSQIGPYQNADTGEVASLVYDPRKDELRTLDGKKVTGEWVQTSRQMTGAPGDFSSSEQANLDDQILATQNLVSAAGNLMGLLEDEPGLNTLAGRAASAVNSFRSNVEEVARQMGVEFEQDIFDPNNYSDEFEELGITSDRAQSLFTSLAFQAAMASGQSGRAISDRDVKMFLQQVGAGASDPKSIGLILGDVVNRMAESTQRRLDYARRVRGVDVPYQGDFGLSTLPSYRETAQYIPALESVGITRDIWDRMTPADRRQLAQTFGATE